MLHASDLLTSYNEAQPPYIKLGTYQLNWKRNQTLGYEWMGIYYKAVRVGNSNSNYQEVYTGTGTPCGSPCQTSDDSSSSSSGTWSRTELMYWTVIPTALIVFFSIILYIGSNEAPPPVPASSSPPNTEESQSKRLSFSTQSKLMLSYSIRYSFGNFYKADDSWEAQHMGLFRSQSTPRKVFWYFFAACMTFAMMAFGLALYGRPVKHSSGLLPWAHLTNWTPIQATLVMVTFTMMTIYFFPLFYLRHDFVAGQNYSNNPKFLKRIGVIIPCHKSAGEIGEVIRRVLKYIPADNVVVCDNGNYDWPPDNTFEVVKNINPRIRYCYIKQGHKTRALWTGVHRLPAHVDYVIHLDDDTHFSDHMVFDESHFLSNPKVIAVAFLRSSYPLNDVTKFTDLWYKITDHFHATQAKICTRCFVPGPAGLWKRDKFIEIFGEHPSLPFGEDIFGGFTLLNKGFAIGVETRCMVKTFAPPILVPWFLTDSGRQQGYGASSLWKQRAHRWTVSALRITGKSVYSFFTYNTERGLASNVAFRLYRFREYKIIAVQLLYIPLCLVIIARGYYIELLVFKLLLFILPLLRNICINYICWRGQEELQVDFHTILMSPFYNFFLICCAIHGRWKCVLWYLPNVAPNHGMLQRLRPQPLRDVACEFNPILFNIQKEENKREREEEEVDEEGEEEEEEEEGGEEAVESSPVKSEEEEKRGAFLDEVAVLSALHGEGVPAIEMESTKGETEAGRRRGKRREMSLPEKVLREYASSFELFEKDGSSRIVNYHVNPA